MQAEERYTNEQLVEKIQQGYTAYIPILWQQIDRLVLKKANQFIRKFDHPWFELDELYNSAYIFFIRAIQSYKSIENGKNFAGWLISYYLPDAFNYAALGENYRYRRKYENDILISGATMSIDAEIEGADGATIGDTIADPYNGYDEADNRIKNEQLKIAISNVLNNLPAREKAVLIGLYFENKTMQELATEMGISVERVRQYKIKAKQHIIHNQSNKKELEEFIDFSTPWYLSTGARSEQSPVELIVERREKARERHQFDSPERLQSFKQKTHPPSFVRDFSMFEELTELEEKIKMLEEQLKH